MHDQENNMQQLVSTTIGVGSEWCVEGLGGWKMRVYWIWTAIKSYNSPPPTSLNDVARDVNMQRPWNSSILVNGFNHRLSWHGCKCMHIWYMYSIAKICPLCLGFWWDLEWYPGMTSIYRYIIFAVISVDCIDIEIK